MRLLGRSRWLIVTPKKRLISAELSVNERKAKPLKLAGKSWWNWRGNTRRASTSFVRPGSSSCGHETKTERLEPCLRWSILTFFLAKDRQRACVQPSRRCNCGPRREINIKLPGCVPIWGHSLSQRDNSKPDNAITAFPDQCFRF